MTESLEVLEETSYNPVSRSLLDDYNTFRESGDKSIFCHAPFRSIYFDFQGHAHPCCESISYILGSYPEQSIHEIWFGQPLQNFRERIAHNDLSAGCSLCKNNLEIRNFNGVKARFYDNAPPAKVYPTRMEFQLSNICNLECTMCDGWSSSLIRKNRDHIPPVRCPYDDRFVDQLEEFIPHLKQAHFVGGEPFAIRLFYKIWEKILALNPSCYMTIQTNATLLNDKIKKLLKRGRFSFNISLDSLNRENYEKIRINASFDKTISNINWFIHYCRKKKTFLYITPCPMQNNWEEMPALLNFANKNKIRIVYHTVLFPQNASLLGFTDEELKKVYQQLSLTEMPSRKDFQRFNKNSFLTLLHQITNFYNDNENRQKWLDFEVKQNEATLKERSRQTELERRMVRKNQLKNELKELLYSSGNVPLYRPLRNKFVKSFNQVRQLDETDMICHAPFRSLFLSQNGDVFPCSVNRSFLLGKYPEQNILEIFNGLKMAEFRDYLIHNDLSHGCDTCMSHLENGNVNQVTAKDFDIIPDKGYYPAHIDFNITNKCNLECSMCNGYFSSLIRKNREGLPEAFNPFEGKIYDDTEEILPYLSKATFNGGEPLLSDDYMKIWQKMTDCCTDADIVIHTNATILPEEFKKLMEKSRFHFLLSVDSVRKEIYETIRLNAHFESTMKNVDFIIDYSRKHGTFVQFVVCPVKQNRKELPELIKFCNEKEIPIVFYTVRNPFNVSFFSLTETEMNDLLTFYKSVELPASSLIEIKNRNAFRSLVAQVETEYNNQDEKAKSLKAEENEQRILQKARLDAKILMEEIERNHIREAKEEKLRNFEIQQRLIREENDKKARDEKIRQVEAQKMKLNEFRNRPGLITGKNDENMEAFIAFLKNEIFDFLKLQDQYNPEEKIQMMEGAYKKINELMDLLPPVEFLNVFRVGLSIVSMEDIIIDLNKRTAVDLMDRFEIIKNLDSTQLYTQKW